MLAVRGRSREFALLQLIGASRLPGAADDADRGPLLVILLGWTVGACVAAATLMPFAYAVTGSFRPDIALVPAACLVGGTALLVLLGNLLPTRLTLRTRPVDAIGIRE